MKNIRCGIMVLSMLFCTAVFAGAQLSIGIGLPNVSIGINLPLFPELVPVPGYPVYYAPQVDANYFFYDGMYWVYRNDNWYASAWYNGPWGFVEPEVVPLFILRIPVRYYRQPPAYFRGWQSNAPPRWGQHWGRGWEQRRSGWNKWNRSSVPARAPRPSYQRQYSGDRYPRVEQQHVIRSESYRYQPRDKTVRQHYQQQTGQNAPAAAQRGGRPEEPAMRSQRPPETPHSQQPHRGGEDVQRSIPDHVSPQQRGPSFEGQRQQPETPQRGQQAPRVREQEQRSQDRREPQEPGRGRGQGQDRDDDRGRGRDR